MFIPVPWSQAINRLDKLTYPPVYVNHIKLHGCAQDFFKSVSDRMDTDYLKLVGTVALP